MNHPARTLLRSFALSMLLCGRQAAAQSDATAQALFEEGQRLFDQKSYAAACEKLAASQRLDPASGTALNLGRCYEALGKIASAWTSYTEGEVLARRAGDARRERFARDKVAELAPKLPRLTIVVAPDAPGDLRVQRDGAPIDPAAFGVAVPVDPGAHAVSASAEGRRPWSSTISVEPSESKRVEVPALVALARPAAVSSTLDRKEEATDRGTAGGAQRTLGVLTAGVGLVATGIGAFFALNARSLKSDADTHCFGDGTCDAEGVSLTEKAGTSADAATGLFIGGGVLLAAGVIVWLTAPSPERRASAWASGRGPLRISF